MIFHNKWSSFHSVKLPVLYRKAVKRSIIKKFDSTFIVGDQYPFLHLILLHIHVQVHFVLVFVSGGNIKLLLLEEPSPSFLRKSKILPMVGYGYFRKSPIAESTYYKINIKHFSHPTNWDYIGPQPHVNCYNNITLRKFTPV